MKDLSAYISVPLIIFSFAFAKNLNATSYTHSYPYIGISMGQATMDEVCNDSYAVPIVSCDDSDISFKVYGGVKTHRNLAFEVAYIDMGESVVKDNANTFTIKANGLNFSAFGIIPASRNVDMFGKAGLMYWKADKTSSGTYNGAIASSKGTNVTFGIGVNVGVSRTVAIRAELEKFLNVGGVQTSGESAVTLISVGAAYYF